VVEALAGIDILCVRRALTLPLPGAAAQAALSPVPRTLGVAPPAAYREGGVLLLLYPRQGALTLALTRRAAHLNSHAGQISLPGGRREPQDASLAETALREAWEELAIPPAAVELLGPLTPLEIPVSGNRIHPWVGYTPRRPAFVPDACEVAELLEVALDHFLRPDLVCVEQRLIHGYEVTVPYYPLGEDKLWGATAMIMSEFVALLRDAGFNMT
jgi:8-oxo-dGTP pyrophosphatase MutT (NUDIX family)